MTQTSIIGSQRKNAWTMMITLTRVSTVTGYSGPLHDTKDVVDIHHIPLGFVVVKNRPHKLHLYKSLWVTRRVWAAK